MRLGGQFGIDLHFFLKRKIALGIEYDYYNAKHSGTIENHYLKDNKMCIRDVRIFDFPRLIYPNQTNT